MNCRDSESFDDLLVGHANRTLTAAERQRLELLLDDDPLGRQQVAEVDDLHAQFASERRLVAELRAPLQPGEAIDESYQRVAGAAASAEADLRHRLASGVATIPRLDTGAEFRPAPSWPRQMAWLAAAVVVTAALWFVAAPKVDRPALLPNRPADGVLGGVSRIVLQAELSLARPMLTWHRVIGAATYDVTIADAAGDPIVVCSAIPAALARCELDPVQVSEVAAVRDRELVLRVVARDGLGTVLATTGELPLTLTD